MDWLGVKELASQLGVEKDALHVYGAFLIQVAAGILLRRPLSSWIPWFVVLVAALLNEFLDIRFGGEAQVQEWQLLGARHDLINTMVLPTLLLLLCRYAPFLLTRRASAAPAPPAPADVSERESAP
jgi:hypothetical protein